MKRKQKFFKKTGRLLFRIFETGVAFAVVLISLGVYLLHDSPMDARFLLKEVENILLPHDSDYHLAAGSALLGADLKKEGLVQLEISDLKILRPDDSVVLSVPEVRLAYDFWHLLTLNYVPSTVLLKKPYLSMNLPEVEQGALKNSDATFLIEEKKVKKIVQHLLSFKHIDVQDGDFVFQDTVSHETFVFKNLNLSLSSYFKIREKIRFNSDLTYAGQTTRLLLDGSMNKLNKTLNVKVGFPSVYLKPLGRFIPLLEGMDFPVQLSLKGKVNLVELKSSLAKGIHKLNFQIKSVDKGTLNLPAPLTNVYPIQEMEINGVLTQGGQLLKVASSYMTLQSGTFATLNASITGLDKFLKTHNLKEIKTDFTSTVKEVPTEDIPKVWPSDIGHSTHEWVKEHLSKGKVSQADFRLYFEGDELTDLYGDVYAQGVRVDYLPPMAPVHDVQARVELFPDKVKIGVEKGHVDSLQIAGTTLLFTDVDIDPSWATVNLKASGAVKDVFKLLSSKPLEFTQEYGIDVAQTQGQATVSTDLFFELDTESEPDEVKVKTSADITNGKIVFHDSALSLNKGRLKLVLDNQKMQVKGQAEIFELPLLIEWVEYFVPQNNLISTYQASGTFSSEDLKDLYPQAEQFVSGNLTLTASAKKFSDERGLEGTLNLDGRPALIHLYPLGLDKKRGKDFRVQAQFDKRADKDVIMHLKMEGDLKKKADLMVQGDLILGKEIKMNFPVIQAPDTQLNLFYQKNDQDFILKLYGTNWNATEIFSMPTDLFESEMLNDKGVRNVLLDIQLDKVIFDAQNPIKKLTVSGQRLLKDWHFFHAQAELKDPLIFVFDEASKQFKGAYKDLGNLMESFGFKTSISQGEVVLTLGQKESGEIQGRIYVESLHLKDPGFMTQALTILGIIDAFMGKDIVFDEVKIPVLIDLQNQIFIQNGQASGTNLGLTFKGKIFGNELDLQGSLVPAYALNSLPGKIPLIGWFFKNTEGGGLINVPFSVKGTLGEPEVDFHLLKTMTPGFLGGLI